MRQRVPAKERKRLLLEAAHQVVRNGGYQKLTTAAIAKAAKISEPILYRHFPSKRSIVAQLLKEIIRDAIHRLESIARSSETPLGALRAVCRAYPDLARVHDADFQLINEMLVSDTDAVIQALLAEHFGDYRRLLGSLIKQGQSEGILRKDVSPDEGAWHLIHAAIGYLIMRRLRQPNAGLEDSERRWADVAVDGLRTAKAGGGIS